MSDKSANIGIQVNLDIVQAQKNIEQLKKQIEDIGKTQGSKGSYINSKDTLQDLIKIQTAMTNLNKLAERHYVTWKKTGSEIAKMKFDGVNQGVVNFQNHIKTTGEAAGNLGQAFRRHLTWLFTGIGAVSAIGTFAGAVKDMAALETEFNQLKTVLPETENNIYTYNAAIKDSFNLAERYGTSVKNVTDSLRLMGRGYRELSVSEKLAENALKLSVADNFDPATATKVLESVIGAYGKQADAVQFSTHVMDAMTKVSHTSQVSAQDLAEALMRSAAAAKVVGLSFDELNALIAVTARNTGLSGATIGDGWKSIANSIHSSKAITSLQDFNIEVYKIGENGEREFRKVSDVLLDVAIKAKSTDQNLEKLFLNLGGGKFQANKIAAALGDPAEYIKVLGSSINSSSFTDKQLTIQMDTIQRKAQTLKASFEELLTVGGGQSGFADALKGILDSLNKILKGLNNINPVFYESVGYMAKATVTLYTLKVGLNAVETSYTLVKSAMISTTVAQEGLNVAVSASPWGAVLKLLSVAGVALATYCYNAGEAQGAQEKLSQSAENAIKAKQSEIDMTKQQVSYIETLGNAYVASQSALESVGENEAKATELKKIMQTVTESLTQTVGKEAADRILASENIKGAISNEQEVLSNKANDMETSLKNLKGVQVDLANKTINMCNERVNAINNEATAFDLACDSIKGALGTIDEIMFHHLRTKAAYLNNLADGGIQNEWKTAGITVPEGQDISQVTNQIRSEADKANAEADAIKDKALEYYTEKSRKALGTIYVPTGNGYITSPESTGVVGDDKGKSPKTSKTSNSKADQSDRLWDNHATAQLLQSAKDSAKKYKDALDEINDTQARFGITVENSADKLALMQARLKQLSEERLKMQSQQTYYDTSAEEIALSSDALKNELNERGVEWKSLSDEEKTQFASFYKDTISDEKMLVFLLEKASKLKSEMQNNDSTTKALSREIPKEQINGINGSYDNAQKWRGYSNTITNEKLTQNNANDHAVQVELLKQSMIELTEAQAKYNALVSAKAPAEQIKQQEVAVEQLKTKVKDLSENDIRKLNEAYANMTSEFIVEGKTFGSIWKNLWKELANEAIKNMFRVKTQSSTLSTLAGKGKSGSSGVSTSGINTGSAAQARVMNSGWGGLNTALKFKANGGVVNEPSICGEDGEEAVIPLEKNTGNSANILNYASKRLGTSLGTKEYSPYFKNQSLASNPIVNVTVQQQNDSIKELQEANALMRQQNNLLLNSNGSGTPTIVTTAVSSEQVLQVLASNPDALQRILGNNKSKGWR